MKNTINRRNFLRLSALTGAGTLLVPGSGIAALTEKVKPVAKLPTRNLGNTGVKLPILSMGIMRADNPSVLKAAYNAGIVHFDTAPTYQNGKNEEMAGPFFKEKPRDSFFIATKGKAKYPFVENFEQEFAEQFNESLRRLQMDYVDIFYHHSVDALDAIKDERMVATLKKFKSEGKARFVGFSTHANKPEQIDAAIEAGIYDVILISYNFKLKNIKETDEAIARGVKAGIGFIGMKTMTGGVEDAEGKKKINGQACLKWVWKNKNITTVIPGFTNYDQLDECLVAASNSKLNAAEKTYLADLNHQELLYCQNCQQCVSQCAEHLPIPDIMRAYMYNFGYKQAALSKETLAELELADKVCNCETCQVTCTSGFNIVQKIAAITPVLKISDDFLMA